MTLSLSLYDTTTVLVNLQCTFVWPVQPEGNHLQSDPNLTPGPDPDRYPRGINGVDLCLDLGNRNGNSAGKGDSNVPGRARAKPKPKPRMRNTDAALDVDVDVDSGPLPRLRKPQSQPQVQVQTQTQTFTVPPIPFAASLTTETAQ